MRSRAIFLALVLAGLGAAPAEAFDPAREAQNYAKTQERAAEYGSPAYQQELAAKGAASDAELARTLAADPERDPTQNLCEQHLSGCAGDVRFYDWQQDGHGLRIPVLWTQRDGATISGHVWATRAGPAVRPAVVLTPGSVQAPEELYAFAAATLAKDGYVVLTFDVETQGRSDSHGEGADRAYYTAQTPPPFVDGTKDALSFLLSTPAHPYEPPYPAPAGSPKLAADHRPKQDRRVKAGLDAAYNPLYALVNPDHVGLVGHSLGAFAVSKVASLDPRVKALVAYDNLSVGDTCPATGGPPAGEVLTPRVPSLSLAGDYSLTPMPYTSDPDPLGKSCPSLAFSRAGVDTGQLVIRGGTHYEFAYIPTQSFGATLRGMDLAAWYTAAWLDRYLKGEESADRRLLSTRWLDDAREQAVDPSGDGNLFSFYYRSRLDIGRHDGTRIDCENLRAGAAGCPALSAADGAPADYSYLGASMTPDAAPPPGGGFVPPGGAVPPGFRLAPGIRAPRLASDAGPGLVFPVRVLPPKAHADRVAAYVLQYCRGNGPWLPLRLRGGSLTYSFRSRARSVYGFRVRAIGRGNDAGPWATTSTLVPRNDFGARGAPRYRGPWRRLADRRAWRGEVMRAERGGARMEFAFRGSRVFLIGRRVPRGGRAVLVLDGRRRTVSFRSRHVVERAVVSSLPVRGRGLHRLALLLRGGRGAVAVDGLAVRP